MEGIQAQRRALKGWDRLNNSWLLLDPWPVLDHEVWLWRLV